MDYEKKILEGYYQRNNTGFEFADNEQFGDVATYFGVSRCYIEKVEQQLSQLQQEKEDLIKWLEEQIKFQKIEVSRDERVDFVYEEILNKLKGSDE